MNSQVIREARRSLFLLMSGCVALAIALSSAEVQAAGGRATGDVAVSPLGGTGYTALSPARLLDTRPGATTVDGLGAGSGAVGAGQTISTTVVGRGGVPATGAGAVALHVTAVGQTVRGYVTVYPTGIPLPGTSNLNPIPGTVTSNLVIVPVGAGGKVSLFNSDGDTQLIVDVQGWYPVSSAFHGIAPTRVVDTRPTSAKVGAHESLAVQLGGVAGVPTSGVSAVVVNLTSVGATASTFLTVHASGSAMPATSNLNVQPAIAGANLVVVPVGADGKVSIYNEAGSVHMVVDVLGWFASGPGFNPVPPARVADTRSAAPLGPHETRVFQITGNGGVPVAGAGSVVFNLTAARQTERSFLTVFPTGSGRPLSSDLNPQPDIVAPNLVIARLGPDGSVSIYNESGTVDVIIDVVGWQPSFVETTDDAATLTEDDPATVIPVLANDVDHDGHPLQVASVTQPASGTVAIVGGGMAVSYRPPADYCNAVAATFAPPTATFGYTLFGGMSAQVTVQVTCVDDAPVAVDDAATVTEDASATAVPVLTNDTDIDGGTRTITSVTQPANGTVVITGGGSGLTYVPNANYCNSPAGSDTFTYTLNGGDTAVVSVIVTCVDDLPTAVADAATFTEDDAATAIPVLANDTDLDAGPLAVTSVTQPANGTVVITGGGSGLTYAPVANYCNSPAGSADTFTYTLNGGSSATVSVTVLCANDAPSFTKGSNQLLLEDASAQTVLGWATAISAGPADEATQAVSFNVTANTNTALFTVAPAVSAAGNLTFTPAPDANGVATITLTAVDDGGTANAGSDTSAPQSFTITITAVNDAPSFTKGADQSLLEDAGAQAVPGWATAISAGPANESAQTVSFGVSGNTNTALFSVAPSVSPTGTLTFTPAANANGVATITLAVSDDGGTSNGGADASATQTFTITVTAVNDAPTFTKGPDQSVNEDAAEQTEADWATAISKGPADEAGQTLTFAVTGNTNPALFATGPAVSPGGTLTYTPAPNANGSSTITLIVTDNGGTANGGVDTSTSQTFVITVDAVNDAPSFDLPATPDQAVLQDSPQQTVTAFATNISAGPANEAGQTVTFHVSNDDSSLFSGQPSLDVATGDLTYTPAGGAIGTATVSVYLTDNGGTSNGGIATSATKTFDIVIFPPNATPVAQSQTGGSIVTTLEGAPVTITLTATDADDDNLTFSLVAPPSNGSLGSITGLDCATTLNTCTASVQYTPGADYNGADSFLFRVNDGTINSNTATVGISVTAVNDVPSFTKGADQTVLEDSGLQTVSGWATAISAGPANESSQTVAFSVTGNTNVALFTGLPTVSPTGTLTFTPAPNANGSASITLTISDDGGTANGGVATSASQSFTIDVTAVNDVPTFSKGADQTVLEDAGLQTVAGWATGIVPGPLNESGQTVSFGVTGNTNAALFSVAPAVSPSGTLTFTPAANANGSSTITLTISDNGGIANGGVATSAAQSFTIDVTAVNDVPTFAKGADKTVLEDAGPQTFTNWATAIATGPADESGQTVSFSVTGITNLSMFAVAPSVSSSGTLTFTPAANAVGSSTVTIVAADDGGTNNGGVDTSASQSFTINVTAVNDVPAFTKGSDQSLAEDAGLQTVAGWATGIVPGPLNEAGQSVTFSVTGNTNPDLFSAAPAVAPNGTLTYTTAANQFGVATITLTATDNGGTLNGGVATTPAQSFTITVTAVNDVPTTPGRAYGAASLQANMKSSIPAGTGLLFGAADAADVAGNASYTPAFTVGTVNGIAPVSGTITTTLAGVGTIVTDADTGAFTLDPAPGITGAVSFSFTVCDAGEGTPATQCSGSATASFDIAGPVVWFVDPAAATTGVGTLTSPFKTLAEADTVDAANQRVFVYSGTTTTGLTLLTGEFLVGQSATGSFDTVLGITPPATTIARPTMATGTATIGGTVTLATNSKVQGVSISSTTNAGLVGASISGVTVAETSVATTTGRAVNLNAATGAYGLTSVTTNGAADGILIDALGSSVVTVNGGAIVGATSRGVDVNSGTGNFTYSGTITTTSAGRSVEVTNRTGGTVSFTGSVSDSGLGINLTTNTGGTISFSGGVTASTGTNPAFIATGGGTVNVTGSSNTLTTSTGTALNLNAVGGSYTLASVTTNGAANGVLVDSLGAGVVTINGGAIVGATSKGVDINNGTGNFTYAGTITTSSLGRSVEVMGRTAGTVLFSGSVGDSGVGINLATNTGGTINFTGGITASTGANPAFTATGGGTVNVTGSANTLTTTTGTALNVANTTIGASGLNFRSISAGTGVSGPVNGIVLNSTGATGGLTVVGTGAAGTGGTIQHTSGTGVALTATQNVSLSRMIIDTTAGSGISGTGVTNFSFTNGTVSNSGDGALEANIAFNNGTGLGNNINGTLTVTGSTLSNGFSAGLDVQSDAGTVSNATISNNTVTGPGAGTAAISLVGTGDGDSAFNLTKATIDQNNITSAGSAGIQVSIGNSNASGPGATAGVLNDATNIVTITNNAVTLDASGTNAIIVANSGGNPGSRTQTNFLVQCNGKSTGGCVAPGAVNGSSIGTVVLIGNNGYADMSGTVNNNVIDANHTANLGGGNGIGGGNGVAGAGNAWTPSLLLNVTNNVITDTDGNGILLVGRATSGLAKFKVQNNSVAAPINAGGVGRYGIRIDAGNGSSADDAVCLNITANTSAGSNGAVGIGLRKQGTVTATNDFGINGMSATATPGVETYVSGLNTGGSELISATSGFSNCSLP